MRIPSKIVMVEWADAHSLGGAENWRDCEALNEPDNKKGLPCFSVGYLIDLDENHVSLVGSYNLHKGEMNQVSGTSIIPRGMVRSIRYLK